MSGQNPSGPSQPTQSESYTTPSNPSTKQPAENQSSPSGAPVEQRVPQSQSNSSDDATPSALGAGTRGPLEASESTGDSTGRSQELDRKKAEQAPAREAVKEERRKGVDVEGALSDRGTGSSKNL